MISHNCTYMIVDIEVMKSILSLKKNKVKSNLYVVIEIFYNGRNRIIQEKK